MRAFTSTDARKRAPVGVAVRLDLDQAGGNWSVIRATALAQSARAHADASSTGDETGYLVAGERRAAAGQSGPAGRRGPPRGRRRSWRPCAGGWSRRNSRAAPPTLSALNERFGDALGDRASRHLVLADRPQHGVDVGVAAALVRRASRRRGASGPAALYADEGTRTQHGGVLPFTGGGKHSRIHAQP